MLGLGLGLSRGDSNGNGATAAPTITAHPARTNAVLSGDGATLGVTATGGSLSYQWYEGLTGDTSTPVSGAISSTYVASPGSSKFYWCRVTNGLGSADSTTALVFVLPAITGSLRAINASGTATTDVTFLGVNLGDADAGYTSLSAAIAAASSGDVLVYTGALADTTNVTTNGKSLEIYVADGYRHDGTQAGSGATLSSGSANVFRANNGGTVNVYGLRLVGTSSFTTTVRSESTDTVLTMYGCVLAKDSNYQVASTEGLGDNAKLRLYGCAIFADDGADGVVANVLSSEEIECWNCTLHGQSSTARGYWNNSSSSTAIKLNGCIATGSFGTGAFVPGSGGFTSGSSHNHGGANAPGTGSTTGAITDSVYLADATDSAADAHCASRSQFTSYAGPTPVAAKALDIDLTAHVEAYAGCDYVEA
jgi:hypothetical protein